MSPNHANKSLPCGSLPEVITPYLKQLIASTGGPQGPIGLQFVAQPDMEQAHQEMTSDPLHEDEHEVAPALIYKYRGEVEQNGKVTRYGRVLWTVTRFCGSYCRFCTRGREVGLPAGTTMESHARITQEPFLTEAEINQVFEYIKSHPEINEVVLSGGDPLSSPRPYLTKIVQGLASLQQAGHLDVVRIGTRLPIVSPHAMQEWHYDLIRTLRNPYILLHINHPAEVTAAVIAVAQKLRETSFASLLSQSVLLQGVNDKTDTLYELFNLLHKHAIRPYYLFQNDDVYWAKHFTVAPKRAIEIWKSLRPRLSGLAATARFVIDVEDGYGKIPVPEGDSWQVDLTHFRDFKGQVHSW